MKIQLTGYIKKGKFYPENKEIYKHVLEKNEGKRVKIDIKRYRDNRTMQQNKYYWGVVVDLLSEETGYTPEEMHEALKWKFLKKYQKTGLPTISSTTEVDVYEFFKNYIDKIRDWASLPKKEGGFDLNIPDPPSQDIF